MTMIFEVVPFAQFSKDVTDGFIRVQTHPDYPNLSIANYTEKAQFDKHWNAATLNSRGLIYDSETWEVLARPFPKFFNYQEHDPRLFSLESEVTVTDKMDGSLGILFFYDDQPHIATRGSFASEQAQHATALFRERYPDFKPGEGYTALFEIIYPENRIVLNYKGMDDLVLLGSVYNQTGISFGPKYVATRGWKGPKTKVFKYSTFREALEAKPRKNAEGLVVTFTDSKRMVKLKQEDYVILHKTITGLNERTVWEALGEGKTIEDICALLPDEFHQWVSDIAHWLWGEQDVEVLSAQSRFAYMVKRLHEEYPDGWGRKEFAALAMEHPRASLLFMLLDGKEIHSTVWKSLKPGLDTPHTYNKEAAA